MPVTKAIIISDSEILTKGISACLHEIKDFRLQVSAFASVDFPKILQNINGSEIIICDCLSVSPEKISCLRENVSNGSIIGIYFSALPVSATSLYDSLYSIYSECDNFLKSIKGIILASNTKTSDESSDSSDELTPREREVVISVVKGLSNKDIANLLNVSVHTVTTHRRNIASKLQIHSASALTIYAIVRKLVSIDEIKTQIL